MGHWNHTSCVPSPQKRLRFLESHKQALRFSSAANSFHCNGKLLSLKHRDTPELSYAEYAHMQEI